MLTMVKSNGVAFALIALTAVVGYTSFSTHTADFEAEARKEFKRIHEEIGDLEDKVGQMSEDVAVLKNDMLTVKEGVKDVRRFLLDSEQALNWTRRPGIQFTPVGAP